MKFYYHATNQIEKECIRKALRRNKVRFTCEQGGFESYYFECEANLLNALKSRWVISRIMRTISTPRPIYKEVFD